MIMKHWMKFILLGFTALVAATTEASHARTSSTSKCIKAGESCTWNEECCGFNNDNPFKNRCAVGEQRGSRICKVCGTKGWKGGDPFGVDSDCCDWWECRILTVARNFIRQRGCAKKEE